MLKNKLPNCVHSVWGDNNMIFELKLANGRIVEWEGETAVEAAKRFVDTFPNETVIAWRHKRTGLLIGIPKIKEPN